MMGDAQSVASRTESVEYRCGDITHCIESNRAGSAVSLKEVTDLWHKFQRWAIDIGAHQSPDSATSSLETRLQGTGRILEQVVDLLNDTQEALGDLLEIVSGNRENRRIVLGPELIDEDSTSLRISSFDNAEFNKPESDEAHDILDLISDCIGSLWKIAVVVRKATPPPQGHLISMYDSDTFYVAMRYPKLARPGSRWLCERLGRAITMRRHSLQYNREHNHRIIDHDDGIEGRYLSEVRENMEIEYLFPATIEMLKERFRLWGWVKSVRKYGSQVDRATTQNAASKGKASIRMAGSNAQSTTTGPSMNHGKFDFSNEKRLNPTSMTNNADSGRAEDMEIEDEPRNSPVPAEPALQPGPFKRRHLFEDHATQSHGDLIVGDNQMTAFIGAGLHAANAIPAADCPFCNELAEYMATTSLPDSVALEGANITVEPETYRQHVSQHLEELALAALPKPVGNLKMSGAASTGEQSFSTPTRGKLIESNQPDAPTWTESKKHKCPYCDQEFTRHHNLKSHLLRHSQEKPFVCPICQMRFRRLNDLKHHGKLHAGEKPHRCPKCDRIFARSDALARHSKYPGGCEAPGSSLDIEMTELTSLSEAGTSTVDEISRLAKVSLISSIDAERSRSRQTEVTMNPSEFDEDTLDADHID
ncbi:hypothetical protein PG984_014862 [Apiospora sp. TS-2023a]